MGCNKCKQDECGANCAMDKAFGKTNENPLLYYRRGFCGDEVSDDFERVEELAKNLPDVDYVLDSITNYMFTNQLTVKDFDKDKKLDNFLNQLNFNGQRNLDVLKEVAKGYRKYGYYGLFNTGQGLIGIHPRNIMACVIDNKKHPVLRETFTYLIKRDGLSSKSTGVSDAKSDRFQPRGYSYDDVLAILKDPKKHEKDVIVVTQDNFACVRLDTGEALGKSPLLRDQKRVQLILNILDRMNYDISRNGIGTIAIQAKDTLEEQISESIEQGSSFGSGELLDYGRSAKSERSAKIAEDMKNFADQLAETEFNDAIVYSGNFQNLLQLKRDTKATDFLDYLSQYIPAVIAQMLGVPARLFDMNKTVSNIGTHSIIDNAMKNNIIPMRDHFIGQCSHLLQKASGLKDQIEFASYEFTNNYNYNNDLYILDVYDRLKSINADKAEQYLEKNLIV